MKQTTKRIGALSLATLVATGVIATNVDAASLTRTQKTIYNNIRVNYNGQTVTPMQEPFMIDGTVYVSLRDAGQITGNQVLWSNNTVQLSGSTGSSMNDQVIMQKDLQIATLNAKLNDANKKIETLQTSSSSSSSNGTPSSTSIKKMIENLEDDYGDEKKVEWSFDLKEKSGKLYLTVSYESRYDRSDFDSISTSTLEKFLKDICEDVAYDFKDTAIVGELVDETKNNTVISFDYSTKGKFSASKSYTKTALRDLEDDLEGNSRYKKLPNIPHDTLNNLEIKVQDILLNANSDFDSIDFEVRIDLSSTSQTAWNSLREGSNTRDLERFFEDIYKDIEDEFDGAKINGYIRCSDKIILKYEDQKLRLYTF